jgi:hypothetical protein
MVRASRNFRFARAEELRFGYLLFGYSLSVIVALSSGLNVERWAFTPFPGRHGD